MNDQKKQNGSESNISSTVAKTTSFIYRYHYPKTRFWNSLIRVMD